MQSAQLSAELKHFLDMDDEDFTRLEEFEEVLTNNAYSLARDFYRYLQQFPETAAVLREFSPARLERLVAAQAEHLTGLVRSQLSQEWIRESQAAGRHHFALGIRQAWIAGAYLLYWKHWENILHDPQRIPPTKQQELSNTLLRLLIGDLMAQLDGYAQAYRKVDSERNILFEVLMDVLMAPHIQDAIPDELLGLVCKQLGARSQKVCWARYGLTDFASDVLHFVPCGNAKGVVEIPEQQEDLAWRALRENRVVIWRRGMESQVEQPALSGLWAKQATDIEEMAFFPFGQAPLRGVGVVAVRENGYFQQIGTQYLLAFSHLGDVLLRLRAESMRDPLTLLPNRKLFMGMLHQVWSQSHRQERLLGISMLDLDGFKDVNDRFGHAAGDALLVQVVERIRSSIRAEDVLARIGGDEFALLFPDLKQVDDLDLVCTRIMESLRDPFTLGEQVAQISTSVGVTIYPLDDNDPETLLHHADLALYQAKKTGKDQCKLHAWDMDSILSAAVAQREQLALAIAEQRIHLQYQPILRIGSQHTPILWGCESLMRVVTQDGNTLLSPAEFGDALDHPRLARSLGCRVMALATQQALAWERAGHPLRVTVNISAYHLLDAHFLSDVQEEVLQSVPGLPWERLEIEITESAPLQDFDRAKDVVAQLRAWGIGVALDDYGTGNASLTYLQRLPISALKMDQTFGHLEQPAISVKF